MVACMPAHGPMVACPSVRGLMFGPVRALLIASARSDVCLHVLPLPTPRHALATLKSFKTLARPKGHGAKTFGRCLSA
eukprot:364041-Chlamydomonas_euryale.AAC.3